jgi:hypothetical protein
LISFFLTRSNPRGFCGDFLCDKALSYPRISHGSCSRGENHYNRLSFRATIITSTGGKARELING